MDACACTFVSREEEKSHSNNCPVKITALYNFFHLFFSLQNLNSFVMFFILFCHLSLSPHNANANVKMRLSDDW